jgi:hypothetical protein
MSFFIDGLPVFVLTDFDGIRRRPVGRHTPPAPAAVDVGSPHAAFQVKLEATEDYLTGSVASGFSRKGPNGNYN